MDSRGVTCFREPTPFIIQLQGSVNGMPFRIEGKGTGDGRTGQVNFICYFVWLVKIYINKNLIGPEG